MALERRDPLPPGRYSFFVRADEEQAWSEWLREHRGSVSLLVSVPKKVVTSRSPLFSVTFTGEIIRDYAGRAELFDVLAPTPWFGSGYPDIESATMPKAFARRELDPGLYCYWVWTTAGPEVVCDDQAPERVELGGAMSALAIGLIGFGALLALTGRK